MIRSVLTKGWGPLVSIWLLAIIICVAIALLAHHEAQTLGQPAIITGYSLFAVMLFLLFFNVRKRLAMLPMVRVHWWTMAHSVFGLLAVAMYFLHTETIWPNGLYEQLLTGLFYLATVSGIFGYVIQRLYPKRLSGKGVEVIYERIPQEIVRLRDTAESIVMTCARETESDTLARYYVETFEWFFRRPRFMLSHLTGADKSDYWLENQLSNSRQYLNEQEQAFLDSLYTLAFEKNTIDFHFAAQRLMKAWLLVHIPTVIALVVLALWHLLIVNIYGL
ncbi:MAG: hypothetical protein CMO26_21805 [Thiotrichales bacterium]|nr:hypothetical protein [Thiotrichales bacterium]